MHKRCIVVLSQQLFIIFLNTSIQEREREDQLLNPNLLKKEKPGMMIQFELKINNSLIIILKIINQKDYIIMYIGKKLNV